MTYSNGDVRKGRYIKGTWVKKAEFREKGDHGFSLWFEHWKNGGYKPEADIEQTVLDTYSSIEVSVICKVHGIGVEPLLFKQGSRIWIDPMPKVMADQEVVTLKKELDFTDDPFTTYTCKARRVDDGETIVAEKSMFIRNPFFLQSHGECGIQLARNLVKREALTHGDFEARVTMGRPITFPGQVPWQAIISANLTLETPTGSPNDLHRQQEQPGVEQELCGGTIISPFHILTAAHCLKVIDGNL